MDLGPLIAEQRSILDRKIGARDSLLHSQESYSEQVSLHSVTSEDALKARHLLEQLTDAKREIVREKIEALVTHGVRAVFGQQYSFHIDQDLKRNQVTFDYKIMEHFEHGVVRETPLRGSHGGGLVALVGLLLRVVMVLFSHPTRRRTIFLDETLAALDGDKRGPVAQLMQELGLQLNMQFILITHSPEYLEDADIAYEIRPNGEHATLERIK